MCECVCVGSCINQRQHGEAMQLPFHCSQEIKSNILFRYFNMHSAHSTLCRNGWNFLFISHWIRCSVMIGPMAWCMETECKKCYEWWWYYTWCWRCTASGWFCAKATAAQIPTWRPFAGIQSCWTCCWRLHSYVLKFDWTWYKTHITAFLNKSSNPPVIVILFLFDYVSRFRAFQWRHS